MSGRIAPSAVRTVVRSSARRSPSAPLRQQARTQFRFNSTQAHANANAAPVGNGLPHGMVGGLVGGGLVIAAGYGYYHYSGVAKIVQTAQSAKGLVANSVNSLRGAAPEPNEALDWLKEQALHYASFVPGGKKYVNTAFADLDTVREKHGDEVNAIVQKTYVDLQKVASKEGFSLDTAGKSWDVLSKALVDVGKLAGDAADDIMKNHPELKTQYDSLKAAGESYGPEAKKQVDETLEQIKGVLAGGFSLQSASKLKSLITEKSEQIKKLGDVAWDKGMETAKPYLEKSPEIKKYIEENAEALKGGNLNVTELFKKVSGGNLDELKKYADSAIETGKQGAKSAGLDKYLNMIPGGGEVLSKASQLQDIAGKHGKEAEKLAHDTWSEISEILKKKVAEAEKLGQSAAKEGADKVKK